MKAAIINNKTLEVKEIKKPELNKKGAIVKVIGCGLCGSDIVKFNQKLVSDGTVLGHEIVGEIVELDSENKLFKVGDKIISGHHVPCYECVYCKNQNYSMCKKFKSTNIYPGGFAEYIFLSEDHLNNTAFKKTENISDEEASFSEPLACCLRAVRRADINNNKKVLVIGLGSIGLLMGQACKAKGAKVFGCDIIEERIALSESLGFDMSFKPDKDIFEKNVSKLTENYGFDVVFLVAGSDKTLDSSLKAVRNGGIISVFSSINSYETGFPNNEIYYRELTVMGSYSPAPYDIKEALELIEKGIVKVDKLSQIYSLHEINKAIQDTISNTILKAYIKL